MSLERASPAKKFFILCLAALMPFILAEIALQIYYGQKDGNFSERNVKFTHIPYVGYAHKPNSRVKKALFSDRHGFVTNGDDGDRDLTVKPANEFRVFILGGSTVAGSCVPAPSLSITARLETSLKEMFAANKINLVPHVINAGVSAYFSAQESALLDRVITGLAPDYIIMFDGANDFYNSFGEGWSGSDIKGLLRSNYGGDALALYDSYNNMFTFGGLLKQLPIILQDHLALARFTMDNYRRVLNKLTKERARARNILEKGDASVEIPVPTAEERFAPQVDRLERNIRSSLSLTLGWPQMSYAYVLQPIMYEGVPMSTEEQEIFENWDKGAWGKDTGPLKAREKFFGRVGERVTALAKSYASQKQLVFLDMTHAFASKPADVTYACDHVHYTPAGYTVINSVLADKLGPHIMEAARMASRRGELDRKL
ncbi:hypothetical protein H261_07231 [Paramagnetospirillum caucaseum]|uniref:SGNH hydrolase-type esterase domain-containing protein n=1 Tax=Paramagnetospirillum caucaseum TaxID=1244869 RepID=M2Z8N7_9PROT|nr:hypothetical protein [Paramagnetospirillum caucaseum]EME70680.1 hypothetical protein H261_07231 [Paramagnetospirillum caucaseum]